MQILQKRARDKGISMTEMIQQEAKKMMEDHKDLLDLHTDKKKDTLKEIRILKDNGR